jgi:glutathione S-transferase
MRITLYEYGPTRSQRVRWALLEAGLEYESVEDRGLFHSEEVRKIHPMGKLPAALFDSKPLFESAAICTYVADLVPDKGLIAASGTWERALHDQWVAFGLTEMEAFLWHSARNQFVLPEEERLTAVFKQNTEAFSAAAAAMDQALADFDYLVANRFSVTDIIVGYTVNWARQAQLLEPFPNLEAYLARLFERPLCTLTKD